ncbi:MAG: SH3 domain-containing protein [Chloroflexales bacterium]|nr:SH3 domain-containing protein [Chloroflexales bacterium]
MTTQNTSTIGTPTELITRSKTKFALSQARLRREQYELALLSLHGSLENVFRAHLLLHSDPQAGSDWPSLLEAMRNDSWQPLGVDEAVRISRMQSLTDRIAHGEPVTLTLGSVTAYQQFAAQVLAQYGVLVTAPDQAALLPSDAHAMASAGAPQSSWQRYRTHLRPLLIVAVLFIIGTTITILLQQTRSNSASAGLPTAGPTTPNVASPTEAVSPEPSIAPSDALAVGRRAFVRADVDESGLALRAEPGTSDNIPVQLYLSANTQVSVIAGPVEAESHTWWQVRAANQEGWCIEEFLEIR